MRFEAAKVLTQGKICARCALFCFRKLVAAEVAEVLEQYKMCASSRESELRVRLSTCHYYCVKFVMRLMFATRSWRLGIHDCAVRRTTKIPAKISTFVCPPPPPLSPVIGTLASPGAEIGTAIWSMILSGASFTAYHRLSQCSVQRPILRSSLKEY